MRDSKIMEYTAEDFISHKLMRAGFLVAKPKFDQEGTDLLLLKTVKDSAKFMRVQCKGRTVLDRASEITINKSYVTNAFLAFLFVEDGQKRNTNLFCFMPDEVQKWNVRDEEFVLGIPKNFHSQEIFANAAFDEVKTVVKINKLFDLASSEREAPIINPFYVQAYGLPSQAVAFGQQQQWFGIPNGLGFTTIHGFDKSSGATHVVGSAAVTIAQTLSNLEFDPKTGQLKPKP